MAPLNYRCKNIIFNQPSISQKSCWNHGHSSDFQTFIKNQFVSENPTSCIFRLIKSLNLLQLLTDGCTLSSSKTILATNY